MSDEINLTFDKSAAWWIVLRVFNKELDGDHYIFDKELGERVKTQHGEDIHIDDFGGVIKDEDGKDVFLSTKLSCLIDAADTLS